MERLLAPHYRSPENQRFAKHLLHEYDRLFLYLNCPGLEATNWRGEQAIRPAVVARKVWGGNRTERSEEHTSELQSHSDLVCRLLLEKKKKNKNKKKKESTRLRRT